MKLRPDLVEKQMHWPSGYIISNSGLLYRRWKKYETEPVYFYNVYSATEDSGIITLQLSEPSDGSIIIKIKTSQVKFFLK